jgi:hypothetical protein
MGEGAPRSRITLPATDSFPTLAGFFFYREDITDSLRDFELPTRGFLILDQAVTDGLRAGQDAATARVVADLVDLATGHLG